MQKRTPRKPARSGRGPGSRSTFGGNKGRPRPFARERERDPDFDAAVEEPAPRVQDKVVLEKFQGVWSALFGSPVHLDSALSKQSPRIKSILAQLVPRILLRPVSTAEALGVGVAPEEPWGLDAKSLARWRPAALMAERLYGAMSDRPLDIDPRLEDFPPAMVEEWRSAWGEQAAAELADVLGREAPLALRATRKLGADGLLQGLKAGHRLPVKAEVSDISPLGVRLAGYAAVLGTELFQQGGFEIQDEGSQLMALFALWPERYGKLLSERPGMARARRKPEAPPEDVAALTVVDACAGAGGKSLAIADALKGKGRVYAYDISDKKLQALRRRALRAGFNNIQTVTVKEGQESATVSRFRHRAQIVLVDAPCSGWGVLRRNPDIKWRQAKDALARMPEIQGRLLSAYSELVAPEGRLVFGTCTFRPAETTEIVESFLARHPEFEKGPGGYLGPGPSDGFFMQSLTRRKG